MPQADNFIFQLLVDNSFLMSLRNEVSFVTLSELSRWITFSLLPCSTGTYMAFNLPNFQETFYVSLALFAGEVIATNCFRHCLLVWFAADRNSFYWLMRIQSQGLLLYHSSALFHFWTKRSTNFSAGDDHGSNNWHGVTGIQYVMTSYIQKRFNNNWWSFVSNDDWKDVVPSYHWKFFLEPSKN